MIGRILVDYAVFIDGKGYLGDAAQIKLPVIEVKSEEYLAGGMVAPQSIPLGLFLRQTVLLTTSQRTELPMPSRNAVSIAA